MFCNSEMISVVIHIKVTCVNLSLLIRSPSLEAPPSTNSFSSPFTALPTLYHYFKGEDVRFKTLRLQSTRLSTLQLQLSRFLSCRILFLIFQLIQPHHMKSMIKRLVRAQYNLSECRFRRPVLHFRRAFFLLDSHKISSLFTS